MKRLFTYITIICFCTIAVANAGPEKEAIMAKVNAAWQAYKDKKPDDFKKVVDKDLRCVFPEGMQTMQNELDNMNKWDIKSFTISDFDSYTDEPDVIVCTYKVTLQGTYNGQDKSGTYNSGDVWKKEGKNWLAIFHTNIKAEAATTTTSAASP